VGADAGFLTPEDEDRLAMLRVKEDSMKEARKTATNLLNGQERDQFEEVQ
jgi:hypothetical protein